VLLDAQDHTAIEKLKSDLTTAIHATDVPAIAAIYMENAVVLAPRRDIVRGQNIRRFWRNMSKQIKNIKFLPDDLESLGVDAARETGIMSFEIGDQSSEPIMSKYLLIWQRLEGEWKVAAMTWSRIVKVDGVPANQ
jgi:ketosteroid isomerase-like protein